MVASPRLASSRLISPHLASLAALAVTLAVAGVAARTRSGESRVPIARAAAAGVCLPVHVDGARSPARVELVPDAVVKSGSSESIEYHAEIAVLRGDGVGLAWESEVVDDRGIVLKRMAGGTATAKAGDIVSTGAVREVLDDGFYELRTRVAMSAKDEAPDIVTATQHLVVEAGQMRELDELAWMAESRANLVEASYDEWEESK